MGVSVGDGVLVGDSLGEADVESVGVGDADSVGAPFDASAASQLASSARVSSAVFLHRRMYSMPCELNGVSVTGELLKVWVSGVEQPARSSAPTPAVAIAFRSFLEPVLPA